MDFYYHGNLNANFPRPPFTGMMLLAQHLTMNWDVLLPPQNLLYPSHPRWSGNCRSSPHGGGGKKQRLIEQNESPASKRWRRPTGEPGTCQQTILSPAPGFREKWQTHTDTEHPILKALLQIVGSERRHHSCHHLPCVDPVLGGIWWEAFCRSTANTSTELGPSGAVLGELQMGVVGLTPIIPMCGRPRWRRSTSSLWSWGICPCLFFLDVFTGVVEAVGYVLLSSYRRQLRHSLAFFKIPYCIKSFLLCQSVENFSFFRSQIYFLNNVWYTRNLYSLLSAEIMFDCITFNYSNNKLLTTFEFGKKKRVYLDNKVKSFEMLLQRAVAMLQ